MFRQLWFLLLLSSWLLSLLYHLRCRRLCCASAFLETPGTLAWNVLSVTWSLFRQFIIFGFFTGGSAPSSLVVLGNAFLVFPLRSSERFLRAFWDLPGAIDKLSPSWVDPLCLDILMASRIAWPWPYYLVQVSLLALFITFMIKELPGLLKYLIELGLIYIFPWHIHGRRCAFQSSN